MLITCGKLFLKVKSFPPFIFLKPCASMFLLCQEHTNQRKEKELNLLDLEEKAQELFKRVDERAERSLLLFNFVLMPRKNRLTKGEIEEVLSKGRRANFSLFSVSWLPNTEKTTQFAFVVSKKQYKQAVLRNKAKRRLRECTRKALFGPGKYVFFAKNTINEALFSDLKKEIEKASCDLR